jgi:putative membrane protein
MKSSQLFAIVVGTAVAVAGTAVFGGWRSGARMLTVSQQDQEFINQAWNINTTEMRLGDIAKDNAANDDVKAFGKQMVEDHKDLNKDLTKLAEDNGAGVPTELDPKNQEMINQMSNLHGDEFDKKYMSAMISGHREAFDMFDKKGKEADQTPVDKWAADTAPKIHHHLEMATKTGKEVGADVGDEGGH